MKKLIILTARLSVLLMATFLVSGCGVILVPKDGDTEPGETETRKYNFTEFKQQHGPYGIRIANKAENEWHIKKSLAEVFTTNIKKLHKAIEQLEMMDTLFKAGLRPEGDEFLLHDLKLKYGKWKTKIF